MNIKYGNSNQVSNATADDIVFVLDAGIIQAKNKKFGDIVGHVRGNWSADSIYDINDIVRQGSTYYICKNPIGHTTPPAQEEETSTSSAPGDETTTPTPILPPHDDPTNWKVFIEGSQSSNLMYEFTYDQAVQYMNNSNLVPGCKYRITDYITTVNSLYSSVADVCGNMSGFDYHYFDIILTADSVNSFSETAYAITSARDTDGYFDNSRLEAWELKYCADNDTNRFDWADTTNGKGVIYYMKDDLGNEAPYDFKNILFKRYEVDGYKSTLDPDYLPPTSSMTDAIVGIYSRISGGYILSDYIDTNSTYSWCYTFGQNSTNNIIKSCKSGSSVCLNNIVFTSDYISDNFIGADCHDMTLTMSRSTVGSFSNSIIIPAFANDIHIGNKGTNIIIDATAGYTGIKLGDACRNILIGDCSQVELKGGNEYIFMPLNNQVIIGYNCEHIQIPADAHKIQIQDGVTPPTSAYLEPDFATLASYPQILCYDSLGNLKIVALGDLYNQKLHIGTLSNTGTQNLQTDMYYTIPDAYLVGSSALTLNLPTIPPENTVVQNIIVLLRTVNATITNEPTITASNGATIKKTAFFTWESNARYELNFAWNGSMWIMSYCIIDL